MYVSFGKGFFYVFGRAKKCGTVKFSSSFKRERNVVTTLPPRFFLIFTRFSLFGIYNSAGVINYPSIKQLRIYSLPPYVIVYWIKKKIDLHVGSGLSWFTWKNVWHFRSSSFLSTNISREKCTVCLNYFNFLYLVLRWIYQTGCQFYLIYWYF